MFHETDETGRQFSSLVIFDDGKRILLLLRPNNKNVKFPNLWSFPGGGSEKGEMPHQAAFREAYEETGLKIDVPSLKKVAVLKSDNKNVYVFRTMKWEGAVDVQKVQEEHQKHKWVPYKKLKNYDMPANNLELIYNSSVKNLNEIRILIKK